MSRKLLVSMLSAGVMAGSLAYGGLNGGLAAYYPFNGSAQDESGNGLNGVASTGVVFAADQLDISGSAADFNGSTGIVTVNDDGTLSAMNRLSVALWFTADSWPDSAAGKAALVSKVNNGDGSSASDSYAISINMQGADHYIYAEVYTVAGMVALSGALEDHYATVDSDGWYAVALVYDGQWARLFVDGMLMDARQITGPVRNTGGVDLQLGLMAGTSPENQYFDGRIDQVRIYNRSISPDDVAALVTLLDDLVAYYPYNEDAGDQSGNRHHGTINGISFTTDSLGVAKRACNFDGSGDSINVPDDGALSGLTNMSLVLWFKVNGWTANEVGMLTKVDYSDVSAATDSYLMSVNQVGNDHYLNVDLYTGAGAAGANFSINLDSKFPNFATNGWHACALTYDGSVARVFVNGYLIDSEAISGVVNSTAVDMILGRFSSTNLSYDAFNGDLDEIRLYNRALSLEEVVALSPAGGLWAGARMASNGWLTLDWFGSFGTARAPWIYHAQHGWMFPTGDTTDMLWLYSLDMGWLFTSRNIYPWMFSYSANTWTYYLRDSMNPRWYYNMAQGRWQARW